MPQLLANRLSRRLIGLSLRWGVCWSCGKIRNMCDDVRELTHQKFKKVENHVEELDTLRRELALPVNLCHVSKTGCPIIDDLGNDANHKTPKRR